MTLWCVVTHFNQGRARLQGGDSKRQLALLEQKLKQLHLHYQKAQQELEPAISDYQKAQQDLEEAVSKLAESEYRYNNWSSVDAC